MTTNIASNIPGRSIHTYDLLNELQERYGLERRETHEGVHAYLEQLGDNAIVGSEPINRELVRHNPNDLDVYRWITITDEAADAIREAFAASYSGVVEERVPPPPEPVVTVQHVRELLAAPHDRPVLYVRFGPDDEGGEPVLDVWDESLVRYARIVIDKRAALQALGDDPTYDDLEAFAEDTQQYVPAACEI